MAGTRVLSRYSSSTSVNSTKKSPALSTSNSADTAEEEIDSKRDRTNSYYVGTKACSINSIDTYPVDLPEISASIQTENKTTLKTWGNSKVKHKMKTKLKIKCSKTNESRATKRRTFLAASAAVTFYIILVVTACVGVYYLSTNKNDQESSNNGTSGR